MLSCILSFCFRFIIHQYLFMDITISEIISNNPSIILTQLVLLTASPKSTFSSGAAGVLNSGTEASIILDNDTRVNIFSSSFAELTAVSPEPITTSMPACCNIRPPLQLR